MNKLQRLNTIRKEIGLEQSDNIYLTRSEIIHLLTNLRYTANFNIPSDSELESIATKDLLPAFVYGWITQSTVSTHPTGVNVNKIMGCLRLPRAIKKRIEEAAIPSTRNTFQNLLKGLEEYCPEIYKSINSVKIDKQVITITLDKEIL